MSNRLTGVTLVPRQRTAGSTKPGPEVTKSLASQTGNADTEPGVPAHRPPTTDGRQADAITHAHLTNRRPYQLRQRTPGPLNTRSHGGRGASSRAARTTARIACNDDQRLIALGRGDRCAARGHGRDRLTVAANSACIVAPQPSLAVDAPSADPASRLVRSRAAVMTTSGVSPSVRIPLPSASPALPSTPSSTGSRPRLGGAWARPTSASGESAAPVVTSSRVDEHHAAGLVWVSTREQPSQKPSVGMADEHVRRLDPATVEQPFEIPDLVARVMHPRNRFAHTDARPVVRARPRRPAELLQHIRPVLESRQTPLQVGPSECRSPRTPRTGCVRRHRPARLSRCPPP